jgi:hypothetical protein
MILLLWCSLVEFKYKYNVMVFTLMNTLYPDTAPLTYVSCVNIILIGRTGLGTPDIMLAGARHSWF